MGGTAFVKIFGVELVIKICVGLVRIAGASRMQNYLGWSIVIIAMLDIVLIGDVNVGIDEVLKAEGQELKLDIWTNTSRQWWGIEMSVGEAIKI